MSEGRRDAIIVVVMLALGGLMLWQMLEWRVFNQRCIDNFPREQRGCL